MNIQITIDQQMVDQFQEVFAECFGRQPSASETEAFFKADILESYQIDFEDGLEDAVLALDI